ISFHCYIVKMGVLQVDSGCSCHMTGNKAYLSDYEDYNEGFVAFGSDPKGAPRKDDVYNLDLKNIVPSGGITCLYANATSDESKLWHKRLGHVNFKNINKLFKGHLVRGLPSKVFMNDYTCGACKKGKQHKASCKAKLERTIRKPLELHHMDLFGPVLEESINKNKYYLVVTDDVTRFSWVFFLATKDETAEILCKLIICLENQLNHKVKIIRCDHETEFKNHAMNEFCAKKGIKREFRSGPDWMFDLDFLTNTMNYIPVSVENQISMDACTQESYVVGSLGKYKEPTKEYVTRQAFEEEKRKVHLQSRAAQLPVFNKLNTGRSSLILPTHIFSAASTPLSANAGESSFVYLGGQIPIDASTLPNADLPTDPNMPDLEDVSNAFPNDGIFSGAYDDDDVGAEANFNNMDHTIDVSPIPTLRIHKVHPKDQILGDPKSAVQTRGKIQKASSVQQALVSYIHKQNRTNHKDHQNCLLACFLSQEEPKNISQALQDESWVEAMQEELLQFKLQKPCIILGFTGQPMMFKSAFLYGTIEEEFWQQQQFRTLANGTPELVASIDNKEYTITEASVRSKLQLADAAGISNLPDAEIYDGLAPLGGYAGDYVPLLPAMLAGAAEDQGEGSAIPAEPQHTPTDPVSSTSQPTIPSTNEPLPQPSPPRQLDRQDTEIPQSQGPTFTHVADKATTTGVRVGTEGATTTTFGLDAGLDNGNIHESQLRSHEAPLHEGHTSGSIEDNLQLKELMVLVPKLVTRIANLEKELHQTKTTYGKAVLTLVERVKSLEVALKRKTKKVVVSDSEDEETENQGRKIQDIDDDSLVSLVRESMKEKDISTDLDALLAKRISEKEELSEQQKKIKVEVQEAAQFYTEEDWDTIRAKLKANAELTKSL
ncbi:putative ribonuclease H-like domain-containing protein, partial [Tanacetum coccineum]